MSWAIGDSGWLSISKLRFVVNWARIESEYGRRERFLMRDSTVDEKMTAREQRQQQQ